VTTDAALTAPPLSTSAAATGRNLAGLVAKAWKLTVWGPEGVPRTGPIILASNHTAFLDGLFLLAASPRPVHVLVSSDIYVAPFARVLTASAQIRMESDVPDRAALARALGVLRTEGVVGIFPEADRGRGDVRHVDHGVAYLAANTGALVVPVAILGARPAGSGRDAMPRPRSRVDVVFGAPIDIRVDGDARRRAVLARSGERVRQLLSDHVRWACARTGQNLPGPLPDTDTSHRSNS
jgi:1-acyl-sn-glycerol-3-phosphate acyltransferase